MVRYDTPTRRKHFGLGAFILTVVIWSPSFAAIRIALKGYSPDQMALGRYLIASIGLLIIWLGASRRMPARGDLPRVIAAGLLGIPGYQIPLAFGERTVGAGIAALLTALTPLVVVLLAAAVLRERLTPMAGVGTALGLGGTALVTATSGGGLSMSIGAPLVLVAATCQAGWIVLLKPLLARYRATDVTIWTIWVGTTLMLSAAPGLLQAIPSAPRDASLAMAFLGVGPSLAGFLSFAVAESQLSASTTGSLLYLLPIGAVFVAWWWLGEVPSVLEVLGGAIALIGVLIISRANSAPPSGRGPGPALDSGEDRRST